MVPERDEEPTTLNGTIARLATLLVQFNVTLERLENALAREAQAREDERLRQTRPRGSSPSLESLERPPVTESLRAIAQTVSNQPTKAEARWFALALAVLMLATAVLNFLANGGHQ